MPDAPNTIQAPQLVSSLTMGFGLLVRCTAVVLLMVAGQCVTAAQGSDSQTLSNPMCDMEMGDPFMLRHDGVYYLTGTTKTGSGFELWSSTNLKDWIPHGMVFTKDDHAFGERNFWAPELFSYQDRYYLAFSALGKVEGADSSKTEFRLCLAGADKITGPYELVHAPWCDNGQSVIDAHVFVDQGVPYLFYTHVGVMSPPERKLFGVTYAVRLADDLSQTVGEPVVAARATQAWETVPTSRSLCNEGAFVTKSGDVYFLTYSAGHYAEPTYAIGYATAPTPLGPWTKSPHNPLLSSDLGVGRSGPGHCCLTTTPAGQQLMVFHTHADPDAPSGRRRVNVGLVTFDGDQMNVTIPPTKSAGSDH